MRLSQRQQIDADLRRCLHAFPARPPRVVDTRRPGFWARAWEKGIAVPLAHQLGKMAEVGGGHRLQAAYGIRSLSALREALPILAAAGVATVPLKGPLLGARLYPDYTWRPTSDVDLLVRAADLDRAVDALVARGGRLEEPYAENRESHLRFSHHLGVAFRGVVIEVHLRASNHFGVPFPSEPLLERSHAAEVLGLPVRRLDPTDELVFLAIHAASHLWVRDILLLDLRLLAEREAINWDRAARFAAQLGLSRVLRTTLAAAQFRVGLALPRVQGRWESWSGERLRNGSAELGVMVAKDSAEALRILLAESLWVDSVPTAIRFLGERLLYGAHRRLRAQLGALTAGAPAAPDPTPTNRLPR